MKYGFLLTRRGRYWRDTWAYGAWDQYIVSRSDGRTQCARISHLPLLLIYLGVGLITVAFPMPMSIATGICVAAGVGLLATLVILQRLGFILMVAVGPPNRGAERVLPGEE